MGPICEAIRRRRLLEFEYSGRRRLVAPYCHGWTKKGERLRAVEIDDPEPFGKLWSVEKMAGLRVTDTPFLPNDPNYNPNDSAMERICCCV